MKIKSVKTKTKRKKTKKFYKVSFKISSKQKKMMDFICNKRKCTSTRLVKDAIKDFLKRYSYDHPIHYDISPSQLELFVAEDFKPSK